MSATTTWLERWDAQQETYMPDREERFEVLIDLLEMTAGPRPRVLDLACGPASLSDRVLARLPEATVVGVDADPVLLTLAREAARPGLQLVDADLRDPDWALRIPSGPYDAVLSTTALHWLTPPSLRAVYAACARLLRPVGCWRMAITSGSSPPPASTSSRASSTGAGPRATTPRARTGVAGGTPCVPIRT
jgi:trans-aconitate methyltransferase